MFVHYVKYVFLDVIINKLLKSLTKEKSDCVRALNSRREYYHFTREISHFVFFLIFTVQGGGNQLVIFPALFSYAVETAEVWYYQKMKSTSSNGNVLVAGLEKRKIRGEYTHHGIAATLS